VAAAATASRESFIKLNDLPATKPRSLESPGKHEQAALGEAAPE